LRRYSVTPPFHLDDWNAIMTDKNSSGYFVLRRNINDTTARITDPYNLPRRARNWISGELLSVPVPNPIIFTVEEGDEGELGTYYNTGAPLMSNKLVEILQSLGVDNLELHDALIREVVSGNLYYTHRAVNIIGKIRITDKLNSQVSSIKGLAQWVHKMVPDSAAARGALVFRMAEGLGQIIVQQKIKDAIEAHNLPLIYFTALEDFSG
jgi:hypothetical protein